MGLGIARAVSTGSMLLAIGSGAACRQIAGIEDVELPAPLDAGARCDCPGCTILAVDLAFPVSVARVGGDLYVAEYGPDPGKGAIVRVPSAGGPVSTVVDALDRPSALATDGSRLYWLAEDGKGHGVIESRPVAGGPTVRLAGGLVPVPLLYKGLIQVPTGGLLALGASTIYFIAFAKQGFPLGVLSVPKSGGAVSAFVPDNFPDGGLLNPVQIFGIAADVDGLALIDSNVGFSGILKAPFPTGAPVVLAQNLLAPVGLSVGKGSIAFIDVGLSAKSGSLQSIPRTGGTPTVLATGLETPWAVLSDDGYAYCTTLGLPTGGAIVKVPADGGKETFLVSKTPQPAALVADARNVYWVDPICKSLVSAPR